MKTLDTDLEIARQQIPQSWQASYRKALSGNRPAAVKVMCGQCQGWEDGARQAIRDCPSVGCPLHAVRPFQKKTGKLIDSDTETDIDNENDNVTIDLMQAVTSSLEIEASERTASKALADVKAKILDHLYRKGESARAYIIFSTGIPESLWSEAVRSLLAEGEIEREGEKRSTRYRLKE